MPLTQATLDTLAEHLETLVTHASLHSADPGTTGANETTAARQPVVWGTGDPASISGAEEFTGGASNGAVTHFGLWSAATGGTYRGGGALTGDQTFNAAGEYRLDDVTVDFTSTG